MKSPSGAPVANARMVIKNTSNSEMKSVVVNSDGTFALTDLAPGTSARGTAMLRWIVTGKDGKLFDRIHTQVET